MASAFYWPVLVPSPLRAPALVNSGVRQHERGCTENAFMNQSLLSPMAAHVGLTAFLYALLTVARAPKVWGMGQRADGSNPWSIVEPRISANLSNQFEWPVFFYSACILLTQLQAVDHTASLLAWIFLLGRVLHSIVQICTTNIRLRGLVFTINFLATLGLWFLVLLRQPGMTA
jgi:hypothetical protein